MVGMPSFQITGNQEFWGLVWLHQRPPDLLYCFVSRCVFLNTTMSSFSQLLTGGGYIPKYNIHACNNIVSHSYLHVQMAKKKIYVHTYIFLNVSPDVQN